MKLKDRWYFQAWVSEKEPPQKVFNGGVFPSKSIELPYSLLCDYFIINRGRDWDVVRSIRITKIVYANRIHGELLVCVVEHVPQLSHIDLILVGSLYWSLLRHFILIFLIIESSDLLLLMLHISIPFASDLLLTHHDVTAAPLQAEPLASISGSWLIWLTDDQVLVLRQSNLSTVVKA